MHRIRRAKQKKTEDIIIRKNGDKATKATIVIDGDNVTINGKPLDQFNSEELSVLRRTMPQAFTAPRVQGFPGGAGGFRMFDDNGPMGGAKTNKAMLGVVTETADGGAKITEITKESGSEKAGLKKGDVITKVGERKIDDPSDLVDAISNYKPNDKITLTYKRDNKENTTSVTLTENKSKEYSFKIGDGDFDFNMPNISGGFGMNRKPKIGLQIQDVEEGKGVKVQEVDADSPAAKAGLKEGDIITEINGKSVDGVDLVKSEIRDIKEGDTLKFKFNRNGSSQTADIKIPKKLKTADL